MEIGGISAWYFEAAQVKRALLTGIGLVQDKIVIDIQRQHRKRLAQRLVIVQHRVEAATVQQLGQRFEAAQVKRALLTGIGLVQDKIGRLNSEAQTDPLIPSYR
jgi:hypothetical protein